MDAKTKCALAVGALAIGLGTTNGCDVERATDDRGGEVASPETMPSEDVGAARASKRHVDAAGEADGAPPESPCIEPGCVILTTLTGEEANDTFGWVSADLGDVDGDGAHDFVIGAPFNHVGGRTAGRAYAYSGKTGALLYAFTGEPRSLLGFAVASAGDVDGDGVSDVVVGAPQSGMQHAGIGAGFARIYSGKTGAHVRTLEGAATDDAFGFGVAGVGDLDRDGHADVAVSAPFADANGADAGRVIVVSGATGATLSTFTGEAAGDLFGSAVGGLGDVTGDGVPDLVIGARNAGDGDRGRVYVFSGADGARVFTFDAAPTGKDLGFFFASSPGDVNHDGTPDIFASDFSDAPNDAGFGTGRAFVWSGKTGKRLLDLPGLTPAEGFGIGRARAFDVDHDGRDDLIVGAYTNSVAAPGAGRTYVLSGKNGAVLRTMTSGIAGEGQGYDAVGLGDVNGDGRVDFLVTAATNAARGPSTGRAYVIAGMP